MLKITYIGKGGSGETCRMRFDCLRKLLPDAEFSLIDTSIPERDCGRLVRSLGWRLKRGPMIGRINRYVVEHLPADRQQLIWCDKAVFITPETTKILRDRSERLAHFTPDPAFSYHRSRLFFASLRFYDFLVTTKRYELASYEEHLDPSRQKVIYITQGYDDNIHKPRTPFDEKRGVVFVGHFEKNRAEIIAELLADKIPVVLAGIGWDGFAARHHQDCLTYLGSGIFGEEYAKVISSAQFGYGAVSKWIPELHTTRTFEIPACGTALLTEKNEEIASFYRDDEAIFYKDTADMISKIRYYMDHPEELKRLTERGHAAAVSGGYSYMEIMRKLLNEMGMC